MVVVVIVGGYLCGSGIDGCDSRRSGGVGSQNKSRVKDTNEGGRVSLKGRLYVLSSVSCVCV